MIFRSRKRESGGTAVQDPPPRDERTAAELEAQITALVAASRTDPDRRTERELLDLRHRLGTRLLDEAEEPPPFPEPDPEYPQGDALPELTPANLTPARLRAGILRDGCVLVRGLIDRERALGLAAGIDAAFAERAARGSGASHEVDLYEEFQPDPRFAALEERDWIELGGGVLAVDSPHLVFDALDALDAVGFPELVRGYLGEHPTISAQKTTLRKAEPQVTGAWHQDGKFLGDVRALNLWLSLSRCGDEAPGLDIVPRRLDGLVKAGDEDAFLSYQVSDETAAEAAGDREIIRPIFEPGDALLFDELFLHQTGSDPSMPKPRFALESWFFGPSAFPEGFAPVAL